MEDERLKPMVNDEESIKWLKEFSNQNEELKQAWNILEKYYNSCLDELKKVDEKISPFINDKGEFLQKELDDAYSFILEKSKDSKFLEDFCNEFKITSNNLIEILNKVGQHQQINLSEQWLLARFVRYYNMKLKLGHSARICFVSLENLKNILPKKYKEDEYKKIKVLMSAVVHSSLLHDIGRFYQSVNYNSLVDKVMKESEIVITPNKNLREKLEREKIERNRKFILLRELSKRDLSKKNKDLLVKIKERIQETESQRKKIVYEDSLSVDHAIAGYYYALSNAFQFQKLQKNSDIDIQEQFIVQAVCACVVRFHQLSNTDLAHFESTDTIDCLNDSNLLNDLFDFVTNAYDESKVMNNCIADKFNAKHKDFIDKFFNEVEKIIKTENTIPNEFNPAEGFDINFEELARMKKAILPSLNSALSELGTSDAETISKKIISILYQYVNNNLKTNDEFKINEELRDNITEMLKSMINYDVAEGMSKLFMDKENNISPAVRYIISSSLSNTMDADKIDILNQRALGTYNVPYNQPVYRIFVEPCKTLKEQLEEYFCFNFDAVYNKTSIIRLINILNKLSNTAKKTLKNELNKYNLFDEELNISTNVEIFNDSIKIGNSYINYNDFINIFNINLYESLCNYLKCSDMNSKQFKKEHLDDGIIEITSYDLASNLGIRPRLENGEIVDIFGEPVRNKEEIIQIYQKIMLSDNLISRFKKEGYNPVGMGWINECNDENSYHVVNGSVSGLLWQLNQFVFVNMRNISSYKFLKEYDMVNKIKEQYKQQNSMISEILDEYFEYANYFIEKLLYIHDNEISINDISKEIIEKYNINNETLNMFKSDMLTAHSLELLRVIIAEQYKIDKENINGKIR